MPKPYHKHKLFFDENMDSRRLYSRVNQHFDVKHIRDDLQHGGYTDPEVYRLALSEGRIIVTLNGRDFSTAHRYLASRTWRDCCTSPLDTQQD